MANTNTTGEPSVKYEPLRYCGGSVDIVLLAHSYRKYIRANPNSLSQASAHGGTSKYAQWKLHAMSKDIFKLQNLQSNKYLRIINNGKTVDIGGSGGKFTLFKAIQHNPSTNNMLQPHQISLESIQFPGFYIAVNGQCNIYSYNINNCNGNKNDIHLYLYSRPQINNIYEQKEAVLINNKSNNILKPGIVAIQHALNKHLRVKPGNEINANAQGGRGKFAQWQLEIHGQNLVKFKSTKSGRYLRIINNGTVCNVGGGGGIYTLFKYDSIHKTLESNKFAGFYLAIDKHNKSNVYAINKSMNDNNNNNNDYLFQFNIIYLNVAICDKNNNSIVVIQHAFGKSLRVKPGNECIINGNGGRGKFARWNIEYFDNKTKIKLKSTKSNKYLRIIKNGNGVDVGGSGGKFTLFKYNSDKKTLESNIFAGYFLAVNQNNNTIISVEPHSIANNMFISMQFDIISVGNRNRKINGQFHCKYNFSNGFSASNVVVIRSENNHKSLRIKPGNIEISNCLGGYGGYAQWNITNHGNNIYKLQNINGKCMKYIRISPINNGSQIDVRGTGGKYTEWRIELMSDINIIVFESVIFSNKYLAVDKQGNVYVYDKGNNLVINNNDCMFSVWMQSQNKMVGNGNNDNNKDIIIKNQQMLIQQQKAFIDQLQKTVADQQEIINNLNGNNNNNNNSNGYNNMYPVLQSNVNQNGNGIGTNNGENDDGFEYVSSPGASNNK